MHGSGTNAAPENGAAVLNVVVRSGVGRRSAELDRRLGGVRSGGRADGTLMGSPRAGR
jgi:hypothetical protein